MKSDAAVVDRRRLIRDQLIERAATLFAERGFSRTSLQDVADAMGLSRPAVYHYVASKEAILEALVTEASVSNAESLLALREQVGLSSEERLREAIRGMALRSAHRPIQFRLLITSVAYLPPDVAATHERAKREVLDHLTAIVADAVRSGTFRQMDERLVAFGLIGMVLWIPLWYQPGGRSSPEQVAEEFVRLALDGLKRPDSRHAEPGLSGALNLLREDLGYLERLIDG